LIVGAEQLEPKRARLLVGQVGQYHILIHDSDPTLLDEIIYVAPV
jgi:hypothetical protein